MLNGRRLFTNLFVVDHTSQCPVHSVVAAGGDTANVCAHSARVPLGRLNVFRHVPRREVKEYFDHLRFKRVFCNVLRVRFLVQGFVQGRFNRTVQFNGQGFLGANGVFSDRFHDRDAVNGSVHRLFLSVFLHRPAWRFTAAVVVRIGVSVER